MYKAKLAIKQRQGQVVPLQANLDTALATPETRLIFAALLEHLINCDPKNVVLYGGGNGITTGRKEYEAGRARAYVASTGFERGCNFIDLPVARMRELTPVTAKRIMKWFNKYRKNMEAYNVNETEQNTFTEDYA